MVNTWTEPYIAWVSAKAKATPKAMLKKGKTNVTRLLNVSSNKVNTPIIETVDITLMFFLDSLAASVAKKKIL